jgi:S-disulfanyl-L-cysteine oxidoreductase SoxD
VRTFRSAKGVQTFRFAAALSLCAVLVFVAAASGQPSSRSVWDGVYSAEQAKRGEPLYTQYCAACHGTTLEGGEMAPPLAGGAFNANWNGLTLGDLADRTRISMPQSNPGILSRAQVADIMATMLAAGGFPAGQAELPREGELLKQINFVATKP